MSFQPGSLVRLETERFTLASMLRDDIDDDFISWLGDPEVMLGLNLPRRRLSRGQAVHYVMEFTNRKDFMLLMRNRNTGENVT